MTWSPLSVALAANLAVVAACVDVGEPPSPDASAGSLEATVATAAAATELVPQVATSALVGNAAPIPYGGGAVLGSALVVGVLWGTGDFAPYVASTRSPSLASFYQGVLTSPYADLLAEYGTPSQPIARGSFAAQYTITPSTKAATVSDDVIAQELARQIAAGKLPAPLVDKTGKPRTYYAVFFPRGIKITRGGATSCAASAGFCSYHAALPAAGTRAKASYGVHPDMQPGSGCDLQCGVAPGPFQLQTAVASRALVGAITNPDVPAAWFSPTAGEVSDVCGERAELTGGDNVAYTVQQIYSNAQGACVLSPPGVAAQTGDFAIALGAASASVVQGGSTSTLVSTQFVSGVALPVAFSVSGVPATMSATTLVPAIKAGGATTLVVSSLATAAPGAYPITVTGTEGAKTHRATFTVTVLSDFSLTASPTSLALSAGSTTTASIAVNGGSDPVTLAVSDLPVGVTGSFSPAVVAPGRSATLTLSASSRAVFGPATVTITAATSRGVTHTKALALVVSGNSFDLGVSLAALTIPAGQDGSVTVSTTVASGVPQPVSFVLSNLAPVNGTGSFAPTTVMSGSSTTLTFHMKPGASAGTTKYWITATGPSGPAKMASVAVTTLNDDFAFGAMAPASITLQPGGSQRVAGTTSLAYGASQPIALSIEGVPQGVTAVVTPPTIKPGSGFAVTFSSPAAAKMIPGAWTVSIVGTTARAQHSATLIVTTAAAAAKVARE